MVELWAVRLDQMLTAGEYDALCRRLPSERQARLNRRRETHREILCAYHLLKRALRERYGWHTWPEICTTERGKPYFPEHPSVHFSLSHTEGAVLVGTADREIGVDVERIRPVRETLLRGFGAEQDDFFDAWVRREARTKCSGVGIGAMMREELPLKEGEWYRRLELFSGYAAGIAGTGAPGGTLHILSQAELLGDAGDLREGARWDPC